MVYILQTGASTWAHRSIRDRGGLGICWCLFRGLVVFGGGREHRVWGSGLFWVNGLTCRVRGAGCRVCRLDSEPQKVGTSI